LFLFARTSPRVRVPRRPQAAIGHIDDMNRRCELPRQFSRTRQLLHFAKQQQAEDDLEQDLGSGNDINEEVDTDNLWVE
jgi:hypothetical protein